LVRARKKDGKQVLYYEWFVRERDCDIKNCSYKASNVLVSHTSESYTEIAMCDHHYDDLNSEEGLDKPFIMKDNIDVKSKT
jgi:hypothetical protein